MGGTEEVREAIADMVNRQYRRGRTKYTADNVSFASGGRLALTRLFTILADGARIAYKNPDYTAYEDYLHSLRNRCVLLPMRAEEEHAFSIPAAQMENFIHQERADALVFSNPCNPTGELISGDTLERYVAAARRENCLLGSDEFYSHFIYEKDGSPANGPVSAAEFVEDVDRDPVVSFRRPDQKPPLSRLARRAGLSVPAISSRCSTVPPARWTADLPCSPSGPHWPRLSLPVRSRKRAPCAPNSR